MTQVQSPNYDNLPKIGYYVNNNEKKENFYKNESHIHRQGPLRGVKATLHKFSNDIFTYFPKGFQGSKNSDFYEFLSMGMVPNLIGSLTLIGLYNGVNSKLCAKDSAAAKITGKQFGAGVVLYAIGKWLGPKLAKTGIKHSTGVDLDMQYLNKVNELPENGQDQGQVRIQYPKVFSSRDFYRKDLIAKQSELNTGNIYDYDDKIARKAGFKNKLNAPNQTMSEKIRQLISRETALENVTKYIVAATGVALGSQKAFGNIRFKAPTSLKNIASGLSSTKTATVEAAKQLWKGKETNALTKNFGKGLVIASAVGTVLTWLIPSIAFKSNPNTMKSTVDNKKEIEVL